MATHEPHDGSLLVVAPDDRLWKPSLTSDWNLRPDLTAFVNAPQMVFGRSQGDIEAARLALALQAWYPRERDAQGVAALRPGRHSGRWGSIRTIRPFRFLRN